MRSFIQRHLDPADRLGEVLFGLIMALGFTAAVRLEREEADNRALFIGILGCNLAWAIVDGVMYALTAYFERGRFARLVRDVLAARTETEALQHIASDLDDRLKAVMTAEQRDQVHRWALVNLRLRKHEAARLHRNDVFGGLAVAASIILATLPVVAPFLVVPNPNVAVRISNLIALTELFLLGIWWGRMVGENALRIAAGLTLVGIVLVLIAIVLGS
jgi:VIT1/CCC1 family predicted Fe2+/Mn2+ transporter